MDAKSDREMILDHLQRRPSVASAIAIGHYHVLNGAPLAAALKGLTALEEMPCDWTVAILDHTITDSTRRPIVRQRALSVVRRLLLKASCHGYDGLTQSEIDGESRRARDLLHAPHDPSDLEQVTDDLCSHLAQAVSDGFLTAVSPDWPSGEEASLRRGHRLTA